MLRFAEDACVQCGSCQATCPEKSSRSKPQLDFGAANAAPRVLKEEQLFLLHPLRQAIRREEHDRARGRELEGKHWMYKDAPRRLDVIKMCDDCRIAAITEQDFDPVW